MLCGAAQWECPWEGGSSPRSPFELELQAVCFYKSFLLLWGQGRGQAGQGGPHVPGVLGQGAASCALKLLPCQNLAFLDGFHGSLI